MKNILYNLLLVFLITSCTEDEGVKFQPDSFYLNASTTNVSETEGSVELTFNVSNVHSTNLTINFELTGTAENINDYTIPTLSVTIPAGDLSTTTTLSILDDMLIEENEDIIITVTDTSDSELFIDQSDVLTITIIDNESIAYQNGLLIPNYGNASTGTISFISDDFSTVEHQIYDTVNSENIGNGLLSIGFNNDKAYLVVTDENKITVVNRNSFLKETSIITGLNTPRYFVASGEKGYVTNWGDPNDSMDYFIAVINLETNTIESEIPVSEGPEKIIAKNGKLYVSHKGGLNYNNEISVIDTSDDSLVDPTIPVGDVPAEIVFDSANNIWVLCEGKPLSSGSETGGKLIKINSSDNSILTTIDFALNEHPKSLSYDSGNLYYELNGSVYSMLASEITLPTTSIITTTTSNIKVNDGKLYTTDVGNQVNDGTLRVFDLTDNTEIETITVGVIPGGIYFN